MPTSEDAIKTRMPFWVQLFCVMTILGIFVSLIRFLALSDVQGFEYVYIELGITLAVNLFILYGIFQRKKWARLLTVFILLSTAFLTLSALTFDNPQTYIELLRNIPFAIYFLFSSKVKNFFSSNSTAVGS